MSPEIEKFVEEMRAYCRAAGIAEVKTLTRRAVNNSKLGERLEGGGECLPRTMAKIRSYMAENPPSPAIQPPAPNPEFGRAAPSDQAAA